MNSIKNLIVGVILSILIVIPAMAVDVKISALPASTTIATTDIIPAVIGGVTKKITFANFLLSGGISIGTNGNYGNYINPNTGAWSGCTTGIYGYSFDTLLPYVCINGTEYALLYGSVAVGSLTGAGTGVLTGLAANVNGTNGFTTYGTDVPLVVNVKTYMGAYANPQTQSSATAGVACDWSLGSTCEISLAASSTAMAVTSSNAVVGQVYRIAFIEPGANPSNGYTPTYSGATVHWVGGTALVLSTTINYVDYMTCYVRTGPIFDCGTGLAVH